MSKGSKNNAANREKAKELFHMGKKIVPVKFISEKGSHMAGWLTDEGKFHSNNEGHPTHWHRINLDN